MVHLDKTAFFILEIFSRSSDVKEEYPFAGGTDAKNGWENGTKDFFTEWPIQCLRICEGQWSANDDKSKSCKTELGWKI